MTDVVAPDTTTAVVLTPDNGSTTVDTQYCTYHDSNNVKIVLDVNKLWQETDQNPVHVVPIDDLRWCLAIPYWNNSNQRPVTPTHVIICQDDETCKQHRESIAAADMSFPILVFGDEKELKINEVFDGIHRIASAYVNKQHAIRVRFVTQKQHDAARVTDRSLLARLSNL